MANQIKLSQKNYNAIRDHIFDRIHKTGEQVKNDFPNLLRTAIETEAWKHFSDNEGKPFGNLVQWLEYTFPNGASMGVGRHALTYEEALKLTEGVEDVHRVLAKNAPVDHGGRPKKNAQETSVSTPKFSRGSSKAANVLSVRLAQDKPKYYDGYLRGDYRTITAAAMAAGLLKDDLNLRRAKSAFRKMTETERAEFLKWMKTGDVKRD